MALKTLGKTIPAQAVQGLGAGRGAALAQAPLTTHVPQAALGTPVEPFHPGKGSWLHIPCCSLLASQQLYFSISDKYQWTLSSIPVYFSLAPF